MQMQDYKKFALMMATLAEVFNDGKEISKIKMEIYFKSLEKYPIDHISEAITNMINTRVYPSFPKPAEILQEINGKKEYMATEAWLQVINTIKRVGNYQSVKFADAAIHSTIEAMGGWLQLCMMTKDEVKWKQKEFEHLYEVISSSCDGKHPDYLPGQHEINNSARGFDVKTEVIKIGFKNNQRQIAA